MFSLVTHISTYYYRDQDMSADSDPYDRELKEYLGRIKLFLRELKHENLGASLEETRKELLKFFDGYYRKVQGVEFEDDDDGDLYEEIIGPGGGNNLNFSQEDIRVMSWIKG